MSNGCKNLLILYSAELSLILVLPFKCFKNMFCLIVLIRRITTIMTDITLITGKMLVSSWFNKKIRIYHKCEGKIEKSVLRIAIWHHEACQVMTKVDPERLFFLSYPHTNNDSFLLLTTVFFLFQNKLPEAPEHTNM